MNGSLVVGGLHFAAELERDEIGPSIAGRDPAQIPEPTVNKKISISSNNPLSRITSSNQGLNGKSAPHFQEPSHPLIPEVGD